MPTYSVALLALLAGCSAAPPSSSGGNCANRVGTYRLTFTARSGNCGVISEQITTLNDGQPITIDPTCAVHETISNDHCAVTIDLTCLTMDGGRVHETGLVRWNQDASKGTGTIQVTATDPAGAQVCDGTYDATDVRL